MSLQSMIWALTDAPTKNPMETVILLALANEANSDGANAFPSVARVAKMAQISERSVQRYLRVMEEQGLIRKGDQACVSRFPASRRPVVWDLNMNMVRGDTQSPRDELKPAAGVTPEPFGGDTGGTAEVTQKAARGDTVLSPNPSTTQLLTPKDNPTTLRASAPEITGTELALRDREPKPTRLPEDWWPSPDLIAWARSERMADEFQRIQTQRFRDYWHGLPGAKAKKLDWDKTWRYWLSGECSKNPNAARAGLAAPNGTGRATEKASGWATLSAAPQPPTPEMTLLTELP